MPTPDPRPPDRIRPPDERRWRRIESILDMAWELPRERVAEFLDATCASDPELRKDVEALLRQDEATGGVLDRQASEWQRDTTRHRSASRARKRRREAVPRFFFFREEPILLKLNSRHVDQLLRAGAFGADSPMKARVACTTEESVSATPITKYSRRERLDLDGVLDLFDQACHAVQLLHECGVLHGEVEPSWLLVDDGGTEFREVREKEALGEQARSRRNRVTVPQDRHHVSPEQLVGSPLTAAADQWSLGVILYKLLTGHRPFREGDGTSLSLTDAIREAEPPLPSVIAIDEPVAPISWAARLPGDLDRIVARTLRKAPEQRYVSVMALRDELRAFRSAKPAHHDGLRSWIERLMHHATLVKPKA